MLGVVGDGGGNRPLVRFNGRLTRLELVGHVVDWVKWLV
jgi:hypothetical protein